MSNSEDKIIALIDMDCFFCQVEAREHPELQGKPLVVTQYNLILAVNYEAKSVGVQRFIRADEAKETYSDLNIVSVPILRGKGDVTKYRAAGQEIIEVLKQRCPLIERASVDEAYLDITSLVEEKMQSAPLSCNDLISTLKNTFIVGYCDDTNNEESRQQGLEGWIREAYDNFGDIQARKLALAGVIVEEFRAEILEKCKFQCSAGISYNKALAKLACGLHKPNKQSILPAASVPELFSNMPINKIRNFGGKVGREIIETLGCSVMADLLRFTLTDLQKHFDEKTGLKLYNIARGIDNEPVTPRLISKSIGASKNFSRKIAITNLDKLKQWVTDLTADLVDRLQQDLEVNQRRATILVINFQYILNEKTVSQSRTYSLANYKTDRIIKQSLDILTKFIDKPIVGISISGSKFVNSENSENFLSYFKTATSNNNTIEHVKNINENVDNVNNMECIKKIPVNHSNTYNESIVNSNDLISKETRFSKLQEIFPNLDDIDPTVLELLPSELQTEAEDYSKRKNETKRKNFTEDGKLQNMNINNNSNKNSIKNFLIQSSSFSSMRKCTECYQMIEKNKYSEHMNFHVAKNLQSNLNKCSNYNETKPVKRNRKDNTPETRKKTKGIEAYFCNK